MKQFQLKEKVLHYYSKYMIAMGVSGHLIFVFQTHKMWVNQSSGDVSFEGFLIAFCSIISWLIYGLLKKDTVLVCVNIFGFLTSTICILAIVYFK